MPRASGKKETMRQSEPGYPRVEIGLSKPKLGVHLLLNLLMTGVGGFLLVGIGAYPAVLSILMVVTGTLAVVVFGSAVGISAFQLLQTHPGFILDQEGLIDQSGFNCAGRVYWSELKTVEHHKALGQPVLLAIPSEVATFQKEASFVARIKQRLNKLRFGTPLIFTTHTLEIDSEKLYQLITQQMKHQPT